MELKSFKTELEEIKAIIELAKEQKLANFELNGLKFVFSPLAFYKEPTLTADNRTEFEIAEEVKKQIEKENEELLFYSAR